MSEPTTVEPNQTISTDTPDAPDDKTILSGADTTGQDAADAPDQSDSDNTDGKGDAGDDAPQGAPETYEPFTVPEGMQLDAKQVEAFTPVAKELNLTQDQAQKLVNLQTEFVKNLVNDQTEAWENTQKEWLKESMADKEFGGDNYDKSCELGYQAIKQFGDADFIKLMEQYGFHKHPGVLRTFARIGKAVADDTMVSPNGGQGGESKEAALKNMYPSMFKDS